jgi:colicin import membrane protein
MARQLKTFETSLGFFDLAIAAPSMKAALQAWGADSNLFHQGAARESKDPDVVAATLAKPGVVLKRPVGSDQPFGETADLPTNLDDHKRRPARVRAKPNKQPPQKTDDKAALAYEKEQKRREAERRKEEAARDKERARREQATVKAQAALDKAEREHETRAAAIDAEREALESRSQAEDARWEKQRRRLDDSLRKART